MTTPAIATRDLTKRYGRHTALADLSLTVSRGQVFGYLGPNGAGKTTTIKLLVGLQRPTSGEAEVLGLDVRRRRDEVQQRVGYLPGDFAAWPDQTGRAFLALLASLRGGVPAGRIDDLADRLHLDLGRRLGTLSHGNRQKVGIIQAFMHDPELLVLDEPTQGLDPLMQREFLAMVREARDRGRTVLLSSHVLSEVEAVADEIAMLREGRLVAQLPLAELRARSGRRIDLRFDGPVPAGALRAVHGARRVLVDGATATVELTGPTTELLRVAAPYGVAGITTHEADLTEAFLDFYTDQEGTPDARVHEGTLGRAPEPARLG